MRDLISQSKPSKLGLKSVSRTILIVFFILAGLNHFRDPQFYLPLIPNYFTYPLLMNALAGVAEIVLGIGMIWERTRKNSADLIIVMLLIFVTSHIYFIQLGSCIPNGLCVPHWVGWVRLVVIHPLLIAWVWWHRK